jgi:predicted enzyme related to lactoylglutathione lyase
MKEVSGMKYQGLIWAGIYVEDLGASVSFYQNVLGMALLDKGEDWAHFDAGAGTLLELFSGGKSTPEAKKPDQQSIVLGLRVENLERAVTELQQKGVRFMPADSGEFEGTRWAHFSDIEGNRLEVKEIP